MTYKKKALFIWVPTNIKSGVFEELVSHIIIYDHYFKLYKIWNIWTLSNFQNATKVNPFDARWMCFELQRKSFQNFNLRKQIKELIKRAYQANPLRWILTLLEQVCLAGSFTSNVLKQDSEAAILRYSKEKLFWKHAANLQENTHAEVLFQ